MREERTSHGQGVYQWDSDHLYRILLEFRYLIRQALDINIPLFDDSCNGVSSFMTRERHPESWETLYVMKGTICHDSSPQVIYNTTCHKGYHFDSFQNDSSRFPYPHFRLHRQSVFALAWSDLLQCFVPIAPGNWKQPDPTALSMIHVDALPVPNTFQRVGNWVCWNLCAQFPTRPKPGIYSHVLPVALLVSREISMV